jgi:hypothetical protein
MKKLYIAMIIVLSIVIGALLMKIFSNDNDKGNKLADMIADGAEKKQKELDSIKASEFLGWWSGSSYVANVENEKIVFYSKGKVFEVMDENTISLYKKYINKAKTGLFGTFTDGNGADEYIKIGKENNKYFVEIKESAMFEANREEYEKMGHITYKSVAKYDKRDTKYICFFNPEKEKKPIENIVFKEGKFLQGDKVVVERHVNAVLEVEKDKIEIEGDKYQRMKLDE